LSKTALLWICCLALLSSTAQAQSVLERVLQGFPTAHKPTGVFQNSASNFGTISAAITTVADQGSVVGISHVSDALAQRIPGLSTGPVAATVLGGVNSGDVVLGFDLVVGPTSAPTSSVSPASVVLLGSNADVAGLLDQVSTVDATATRQRMEGIRSMVGAAENRSLMAGNSSVNIAHLQAAIITRTAGVSLRTMEATTTAVGSINTGLTEIIGSRGGPAR
jgi:hypothetical protein